MLDFGGEVDHGGRSVEDTDARFGCVLDEPLAVRGEHGRVQELVADQDVRPGGRLGGRGGVRPWIRGSDGVSFVVEGVVEWLEAGLPRRLSGGVA